MTQIYQPESIKLHSERSHWGALNLSEQALAITQQAQQNSGLTLVIQPDTASANQLIELIEFFNSSQLELLKFPEWETLPYDNFSPAQNLVSDRVKTLYRLPQIEQALLIIPASSLMQFIAPFSYIQSHSLLLKKGQALNLDKLIQQLTTAGYQRVSQVMEPGEYAVRGSLIDIFPMGTEFPLRVDFFDDEIDSLRCFDPETQISSNHLDKLEILPAKEYDLSETGIDFFRQNFRAEFGAEARISEVYSQVSKGNNPGALENYLPLFFEKPATLFEFLPEKTLIFDFPKLTSALKENQNEYKERYEIARHNLDYPPLPLEKIIQPANEVMQQLNKLQRITLYPNKSTKLTTTFTSQKLPDLVIENSQAEPLAKLNKYLNKQAGKVVLSTDSLGRREALLELLAKYKIRPKQLQSWQEIETDLAQDNLEVAIVVSPLQEAISSAKISLITEAQLFGQAVVQSRRHTKAKHQDFEEAINNLIELELGSPIVHLDHGVGRYQGLTILEIQDEKNEFLILEYAEKNKLYVPVSSLHLISRYTGASAENAPLHKLGSERWQKAKKKAAERVEDVAAELLEIYAQREAKPGIAFNVSNDDYLKFKAGFPFEETPDQKASIQAVLDDMQAAKPMDRLVCGDVGFGKTEVAMRAAFIAAYNGKQVGVLVPTTLLAQQHYESFSNRFADWPIKVAVVSRFQSAKEQKTILQQLKDKQIDILIGTHKLIQQDVKFSDLGLLIIDEEHRFGVKQKEQLKKIRTDVDILAMTATPIPRTLNMALNNLRDLSIISTPPENRLSTQTFVQEWNLDLVREACLRELRRGGQVYLLYNQVETINQMAEEIAELIPQAKVGVGHGQMPERELERIMQDFHHRRFNILVCTTIIETGLDIPSANTIIIHRADKFGLAQLHQLRGRVGRSHHRAYAYLFTAGKKLLTKDAEKRLEAIAKHDALGAGFILASHDLEIRGAGELLGDDQSGQIHEVGFGLYSELLERAVKSLQSGKQPDIDMLNQATEIDLGFPALIPEDYLPDIQARLVLYKRIASAKDEAEIYQLEVEIIDRFGLMPQQLKNLFSNTRLKLEAEEIGIKKIDSGATEARLEFNSNPSIDPLKLIELIQKKPKEYQLKGQTELKIFAKMPELVNRIDKIQATLAAIKLKENQ